ncbi:MAG: class I SAM-dependent methyltransferase [Burkholderiales bacterium]|nr:class I SAM-dependent methyltransferase [Burkholderiales bacterium]
MSEWVTPAEAQRTTEAIETLCAALARSQRARLVFITHGWGGGVERHVRDLLHLLRPHRDVLVLRGLREGSLELAFYGRETAEDASLQVGGFSAETLDTWVEALRALGCARVHVHHLHGWPSEVHTLIERLGLPIDITLHDYALISPRYHLEDAQGRYVGLPPEEDDQARAWRERGEALLKRAARVIAPSEDVARRYRELVPELEPLIWPHPEAPIRLPSLIKVALIGGLSEVKGFSVLLAVEAEARARGLPLAFRVIGHATRPLPPSITATGSYAEEDLPRLLALERADVYWFPAQVPETWNYALSAAIATGAPIVASDLGSHRQRLASYPQAQLLPHGASVEMWLKALAGDRAASLERVARIDSAERATSPYYPERYLAVGQAADDPPRAEALLQLLRGCPPAAQPPHHSLINLYRLGRYAGHSASADVIEKQLMAIDPNETHLVGRGAFEAVDRHREQLQIALNASEHARRLSEEAREQTQAALQHTQAMFERMREAFNERTRELENLRAQYDALRRETQRVASELDRVHAELMRIVLSRSWRWTRPARGLMLLARFGYHWTRCAANDPRLARQAWDEARARGLRAGLAMLAPPAQEAAKTTATVDEADMAPPFGAITDPQAPALACRNEEIRDPVPPSPLADPKLRAEFPVACTLIPERLKSPWWIGHIPFAFELIARQRPKSIVELGTYSGSSFAAFCQALEAGQIDGVCFGVDLWEGDIHMGRFDESLYEELRAFVERRYPKHARLIRKNFNDAVNDFPDRSIDLLHIDGTHTYEAVKNDFETWLPKMSERGIVLFHDIHVNEENCGPSARFFGVRRLFDEVKTGRLHCEFLHCYGLGVLVVGAQLEPEVRTFIERCRDADAQALFVALGDRVLQQYHDSGEPLPVHREYGEALAS